MADDRMITAPVQVVRTEQQPFNLNEAITTLMFPDRDAAEAVTVTEIVTDNDGADYTVHVTLPDGRQLVADQYLDMGIDRVDWYTAGQYGTDNAVALDEDAVTFVVDGFEYRNGDLDAYINRIALLLRI